MTLPSKYRSPRSRDFRQYYFYCIFAGGIAIIAYFGILNSVKNYGPAFLSGWTSNNILMFVGFFAMSLLTISISGQIFSNIIGRPWQKMNPVEKFIFIFGRRYLIFVIIAAVLLFVAILGGSKYINP